jgi:hypothetical protein
MLYGEKVIVLEPKVEDMWVQSFTGTLIAVENGKAVVIAEDGTCYKVPVNSVRKPSAYDYITVGVA